MINKKGHVEPDLLRNMRKDPGLKKSIISGDKLIKSIGRLLLGLTGLGFVFLYYCVINLYVVLPFVHINDNNFFISIFKPILFLGIIFVGYHSIKLVGDELWDVQNKIKRK